MMAVGNIVKYIFVTIFVFYGTVTFQFMKWTSDKSQTHNIIQTDENDQTVVQLNQQITIENIQDYTNINSVGTNDNPPYINSVGTNNNPHILQRKRRILSQLWNDYYKLKSKSDRTTSDHTNMFKQVGEDMFVFSAFYDNRDNPDYNTAVVRIIAISNLDSKDSLICRFTKLRVGQWVHADKREMSDNHAKQQGGVMYICSVPHNAGKQPPKHVYLQSLASGTNDISKVTSQLLTLELIPVEMSLRTPTIDHRADKLKIINTKTWHTTDSRNSSENIRNESDLKNDKFQTIIIPSKGRKLDNQLMQNQQEVQKIAPLQRQKICACVPPLFGNIKLAEFIQFVEIHRILGVQHFFFYKMNISSDIEQMLDYYEDEGTATISDWTLPTQLLDSSNIWYNGQIVAQQDCLYRSMGRFDFTAFIDMDEVIVPNFHSDWLKMLQNHKNKLSEGGNIEIAAFVFKSAFFTPEVNIAYRSNTNHQKLSFLKNVYRNDVLSSLRTKAIVKPKHIEQIGIHHVSKLINSGTNVQIANIPAETALIHHYRKCTAVSDEEMHCGKYVEDDSLLKYSDILKKNYENVLEQNVKHFTRFKKLLI